MPALSMVQHNTINGQKAGVLQISTFHQDFFSTEIESVNDKFFWAKYGEELNSRRGASKMFPNPHQFQESLSLYGSGPVLFLCTPATAHRQKEISSGQSPLFALLCKLLCKFQIACFVKYVGLQCLDNM